MSDRSDTTGRQGLFINGEWLAGEGDDIFVTNPATEQVIATFQGASLEQAETAIHTARRFFDDGGWDGVSGAERGAILERLADLLVANADHLGDLMVEEIGCPSVISRGAQVTFAANTLRWFAEAAIDPGRFLPQLALTSAAEGTTTLLSHEPIGVVSALTAYNYPLNLAAWKLGGAIASGCAVVLSCSPLSVLTTSELMRSVEDAGVPSGSVNFVYGSTAVAQLLTEHPMVDMVSFTGSAAVGKSIVVQAAQTLKKVVLELGGKSADIILPGADIEEVAQSAVLGWAANAGQGCSCFTRTFVPRALYDQFIQSSVKALEQLAPADPAQLTTLVGPLVSKTQLEKVEGYVARAVAAGAEIVVGGRRPPQFEHGYYYEPTIVVGVDNDSEIAQEELFGPVSCVFAYDDLDEAIALANDSMYGLAANVWGENDEAMKVAAKLRVGTVTINGIGGLCGDHPWGGFKQSGQGREGGPLGLAEFYEPKHVVAPAGV